MQSTTQQAKLVYELAGQWRVVGGKYDDWIAENPIIGGMWFLVDPAGYSRYSFESLQQARAFIKGISRTGGEL